ncbi:hypothetical protein [Aeromicrobium sp. Sec7.5]|uniref:hypothetical protein n=1 Tax=Aeromicrobium sp. Sec7.5 TaxID=3121276 RepID=UPI002FE42F3E
MTTLAHVRTAVKRLAEVSRTEAGVESFAVDGQEFLAVAADRSAIELHLPADDAENVLVDIPGSSLVKAGSRTVGVVIPLDAMNGMQANAVIGRAWAHRAPDRLTPTSAHTVSVDGDLPRSIGRPATAALHGAGIATLAELATRSRAEIGALHGVGPRALRLLGEAIEAAGLSWD